MKNLCTIISTAAIALAIATAPVVPTPSGFSGNEALAAPPKNNCYCLLPGKTTSSQWMKCNPKPIGKKKVRKKNGLGVIEEVEVPVYPDRATDVESCKKCCASNDNYTPGQSLWTTEADKGGQNRTLSKDFAEAKKKAEEEKKKKKAGSKTQGSQGSSSSVSDDNIAIVKELEEKSGGIDF